MAKRAEETENHWPGFVDVLSTIVMVVTFLLIILGIVIFVISKNISTELAASAQRVEEAQKALDKALAEAQAAQAQVKSQGQSQSQGQTDQRAKARAQDQAQAKSQKPSNSTAQAQKQAQENSKSALNADALANVYRASIARELTQNVKIDGKEKHAVRTRKTDEIKQISIARTEKEINPRKIRVITSTAVLSLLFNGGIKISQEASEQMQYYIKTKIYDTSSKYEIRAFYVTDKGSISEARRLAYYRALATRNQLMTLGVKAEKIALKVANSSRAEDASKVSIYQR